MAEKHDVFDVEKKKRLAEKDRIMEEMMRNGTWKRDDSMFTPKTLEPEGPVE